MSEYLPFDLKIALADRERVVTRDGRKIAFIAHDPGAIPSSRLLVRVNGSVSAVNYWENGGYGGAEHEDDLFLLPKTRALYLNVYVDRVTYATMTLVFPSREQARAHALKFGVAWHREIVSRPISAQHWRQGASQMNELKKYVVWQPDAGQTEADGDGVSATDPKKAAEAWADHDDSSNEFRIVGGQPATVKVKDLSSGATREWIVHGESRREYTARLRIPLAGNAYPIEVPE